MKSLKRYVLTTILCLFAPAGLWAELNSSDLLTDEDITVSAKMRKGVAEKIYWKKDISNILSSGGLFSSSDKMGEADFSLMMKHFDIYSAKPGHAGDIRMTLESVEISPSLLMQNGGECWLDLTKPLNAGPVLAHGFITAGTDRTEETQDVPMAAGIEGQGRIFDLGLQGKAAYVSDMNDTASTSRMDLHFKSDYTLTSRWNPSLQFGWDVFGESDSPYAPSSAVAMGGSTLDTPAFGAGSDNLSVMNAKVKCFPFRTLELSLNYFRYAQNKARAGIFEPTRLLGGSRGSYWASRSTNGSSTDLGTELNLSADYQRGSSFFSNLLAGWYVPGDAYAESSGDESVFEIRGEIVVSF